jgi:hypothetical protein
MNENTLVERSEKPEKLGPFLASQQCFFNKTHEPPMEAKTKNDTTVVPIISVFNGD